MDRAIRCDLCSLNFNSTVEKSMHDLSPEHSSMLNKESYEIAPGPLINSTPIRGAGGIFPYPGSNYDVHFHNQRRGLPYHVMSPLPISNCYVPDSRRRHSDSSSSINSRWHGHSSDKNDKRKSVSIPGDHRSSDPDSIPKPSVSNTNSNISNFGHSVTRAKPSNLSLKSTEFRSRKLSDSSSTPINDSRSRPIDSCPRPRDSRPRPIDSSSKPIDSSSRPIYSSSKPIDSSLGPNDSHLRPIDSSSRKINSSSRPIDSRPRPIDSSSKLIDSSSRPIDSHARPIDSSSRPIDSSSRPKPKLVKAQILNNKLLQAVKIQKAKKYHNHKRQKGTVIKGEIVLEPPSKSVMKNTMKLSDDIGVSPKQVQFINNPTERQISSQDRITQRQPTSMVTAQSSNQLKSSKTGTPNGGRKNKMPYTQRKDNTALLLSNVALPLDNGMLPSSSVSERTPTINSSPGSKTRLPFQKGRSTVQVSSINPISDYELDKYSPKSINHQVPTSSVTIAADSTLSSLPSAANLYDEKIAAQSNEKVKHKRRKSGNRNSDNLMEKKSKILQSLNERTTSSKVVLQKLPIKMGDSEVGDTSTVSVKQEPADNPSESPGVSHINSMMETVALLIKEQHGNTVALEDNIVDSNSSILPEPLAISPCSTCCFKQKDGFLCNKQILDGERLCSEHRFVAERLKKELGLSPVRVGPGTSSPSNPGNQKLCVTPKIFLNKQLPDVTNYMASASKEQLKTSVAVSTIATPSLSSSTTHQLSTSTFEQTTPTSVTPPISPTIPVIKMPEIDRNEMKTTSKRLYISLLSSDSEQSDDSRGNQSSIDENRPPKNNPPPANTENYLSSTIEDNPPPTIEDQPPPDQSPPDQSPPDQLEEADEDKLPPTIEDQPPPAVPEDQPPPTIKDHTPPIPKDQSPFVNEDKPLPSIEDQPPPVSEDNPPSTDEDWSSPPNEDQPTPNIKDDHWPPAHDDMVDNNLSTDCVVDIVPTTSFLDSSHQSQPTDCTSSSTTSCQIMSPSPLKLMETEQSLSPLGSPTFVTQSTLSQQLAELNKREDKVQKALVESNASLLEVKKEMEKYQSKLKALQIMKINLMKKCDELTREYQDVLGSKQSLLFTECVPMFTSIVNKSQKDTDSDGNCSHMTETSSHTSLEAKTSQFHTSSPGNVCQDITAAIKTLKNEKLVSGVDSSMEVDLIKTTTLNSTLKRKRSLESNNHENDKKRCKTDLADDDGYKCRHEDNTKSKYESNYDEESRHQSKFIGSESVCDHNEARNDGNENERKCNGKSKSKHRHRSQLVDDVSMHGANEKQSTRNKTEANRNKDVSKHENVTHHEKKSASCNEKEIDHESMGKKDENGTIDRDKSKSPKESKHDRNGSMDDVNEAPCDTDNGTTSRNESECNASESIDKNKFSRTEVVGSKRCDPETRPGKHDDSQNTYVAEKRTEKDESKPDNDDNETHQLNTNSENNDQLSVGNVIHEPTSPMDEQNEKFFGTCHEDMSMGVELSRSGDVLPVFEPFTNSVLGVKVIHDTLYACSSDSTIRSYGLKTGEKLGEFKPHSKAVTCLDYYQGEKGQFMLSGSSDKLVLMTNLETKKVVAKFKCTTRIMYVMVHDSLLYIAQYSGVVAVIDLKTKQLIGKHKCHKHDKAISSIVVHDHNLFSASFDNTVICWDIKELTNLTCVKGKFKKMHTIDTFTDAVLCMKIHNCRIFCGSADKSVQIYCIKTWKRLHDLRCHGGPVTALEIMGKVLVTSCFDKLVRCFDLERFEILQVYGGHNDMIFSLAAHSGVIYTGDKDGTVKAAALDLTKFHKCMWKDCQLPFGVFEHLKDHIKSHCSNSDEQQSCLWEGCTIQRNFSNLVDHIEAVHLSEPYC